MSSKTMVHVTVKPKCYTELLAPEILSMIFHFVLALCEPNSPLVIPTPVEEDYVWQDWESEIDTGPLLSLSHVCNLWRDIALGDALLWRRIHGRCLEQMEVFFERSRPLTATLLLDTRYWGGKALGPLTIPSVVHDYGARLRRLDLHMIPTLKHVPLLESLQAPHLECLTMISPYACNSSDSTRISWTNLLDEDALSLRALAIMPVIDWMPSCVFPHLTHLLISFDRFTAFYHPFDVLRLLSNTPSLAFLHVNSLLFHQRHSGDWKPPSDPIPLRHLRSLVFTCASYEFMHTVIAHLTIPQSTFIRLQDILNRNDFDDHPHPFPPLPLHPVTCLDLSLRDHEILMVADGPASGLWLEGHHDVLLEEPIIPWTVWLLDLHKMLTLSHVTHLHISVDGDPNPTFWPEFLAHLPQVSQLTVLIREPRESDRRVPDATDPVSSTGILCRALSSSPTTPIRCPLLRDLAIEWQGTLTIEIIANFPRIPAMLRSRARAGHPIHRLVVEAAPDSLPSYPGAVTALDLFRDFDELFVPDETECKVYIMEVGATGPDVGEFRMRDVWRVDGEEKYWELDSYDKPRYFLHGLWS